MQISKSQRKMFPGVLSVLVNNWDEPKKNWYITLKLAKISIKYFFCLTKDELNQIISFFHVS